MKTVKNRIVLLAFLLAVVVIQPIVNAESTADNSTTYDVYYKDILITSYGPLQWDIQKGNVTTEISPNQESSLSNETTTVLKQVTDDATPDLEKYYYPDGPVIGHGYDLYGTMYVQINKDWTVNESLIEEIYQVIKKSGQKNGVEDIPCKFLSMSLPKVTSGRTGMIRPLSGGTTISVAEGSWDTPDFKAKDVNNNIGFVTGSQICPLGSAFYQPDFSVNGSSVGSSIIVHFLIAERCILIPRLSPYSNTGNQSYLDSTSFFTYSS